MVMICSCTALTEAHTGLVLAGASHGEQFAVSNYLPNSEGSGTFHLVSSSCTDINGSINVAVLELGAPLDPDQSHCSVEFHFNPVATAEALIVRLELDIRPEPRSLDAVEVIPHYAWDGPLRSPSASYEFSNDSTEALSIEWPVAYYSDDFPFSLWQSGNALRGDSDSAPAYSAVTVDPGEAIFISFVPKLPYREASFVSVEPTVRIVYDGAVAYMPLQSVGWQETE